MLYLRTLECAVQIYTATNLTLWPFQKTIFSVVSHCYTLLHNILCTIYGSLHLILPHSSPNQYNIKVSSLLLYHNYFLIRNPLLHMYIHIATAPSYCNQQRIQHRDIHCILHSHIQCILLSHCYTLYCS